ncbi:MAG: toprim domain-containing protein [Kiritimatiellae bacterium]|nr:toprim domain-containing protein [Kiritimatiellia bacterium]
MNDKPIGTFLKALGEQTGETFDMTQDAWQTRCPVHDDDKASLSVRIAEDGKVLVNCHAGCATTDIVSKLGLTMADLFPPQERGEPEAVYQYYDRDGNLRFEKLRYPNKKFVQRRPDGDGGWIWGLNAGWYRNNGDGYRLLKKAKTPDVQPDGDAHWFPGVERILYREPEISDAVAEGETVCIVEGEKDADNLVAIGIEATTSPGGAGGKWEPRFCEILKDARVVVIPDADEAGRKYANTVCAELRDVASEVRLLELPDLPDGGKDVSDWLGAGHTAGDLTTLLEAAPEWEDPEVAQILDDFPEEIRRPLCLVGDDAYCTTWVNVRVGNDNRTSSTIVRADGSQFIDASVPGCRPFAALGVTHSLPHVPPASKTWSGAGAKRYVNGERPSPADVFNRVLSVVDRFMDFQKSVGSQREIAELVALYIMATYLVEAFPVIGYLWPNGDKGSGKTQLLLVVTQLAFLGELILSAGTFATLRDMADYGATLAFDDCENIMNVRSADPDKRALFLAGNRKGVYVTFKEERGGCWVTRYVNAYCPRLFSAIRLPDDVLASRTITIPLVRSADPNKSRANPLDERYWPCDRRRLIDDLYALALQNLRAMQEYDAMNVEHARLIGRDFEPWRAVLGVALWLDDACGVEGLYDQMQDLSVRYQSERSVLEENSPIRIAIVALDQMFSVADKDLLEFATQDLTETMNRVAEEKEVTNAGEPFTDCRRVGLLMKQQRLRRAQRTAQHKRWRISRDQLAVLAQAYSMEITIQQHGSNGTNGNMAQAECRDAENAVPAEMNKGGISEGEQKVDDSPHAPSGIAADTSGKGGEE